MPTKETLSPMARATWAMAGDSFWQGPQDEDQKWPTTGLPRSALSSTLPPPWSRGRSKGGAGLLTWAYPTETCPADLLTGVAGRDQTRAAAMTSPATQVATAMTRQ